DADLWLYVGIKAAPSLWCCKGGGFKELLYRSKSLDLAVAPPEQPGGDSQTDQHIDSEGGPTREQMLDAMAEGGLALKEAGGAAGRHAAAIVGVGQVAKGVQVDAGAQGVHAPAADREPGE